MLINNGRSCTGLFSIFVNFSKNVDNIIQVDEKLLYVFMYKKSSEQILSASEY